MPVASLNHSAADAKELAARLRYQNSRLVVLKAIDEGLRPAMELDFQKRITVFLSLWFESLAKRIKPVLPDLQRGAVVARNLPVRERRKRSRYHAEINREIDEAFVPVREWLYSSAEKQVLTRMLFDYSLLMYHVGGVASLNAMGFNARLPARRRLDVGKSADFDFRLPVAKAAGDLVFELTDEEIRSALQDRAVEHGAGITEQIINDSRKIVREKMYLGAATAQETGEIIASGAGIPEWRGLKIARTEAGQAFNLASFRQYETSGVKFNQWLTVGDRRVRPEHILNETSGPVELGKPFPNGQLHPGDGPQSINCRCSLIPDLSDPNILLEPWDGSPGFHTKTIPPPIGPKPKVKIPVTGLKKPTVLEPKPTFTPPPKPKIKGAMPKTVSGVDDAIKLMDEAIENWGDLDPVWTKAAKLRRTHLKQKLVKLQEKEAADKALELAAAASKKKEAIADFAEISKKKVITGDTWDDVVSPAFNDAYAAASKAGVTDEELSAIYNAAEAEIKAAKIAKLGQLEAAQLDSFGAVGDDLLAANSAVDDAIAQAKKLGATKGEIDEAIAKATVANTQKQIDEALVFPTKGSMPSSVDGLEVLEKNLDDAIAKLNPSIAEHKAKIKKLKLRRTHVKQKAAKLKEKQAAELKAATVKQQADDVLIVDAPDLEVGDVDDALAAVKGSALPKKQADELVANLEAKKKEVQAAFDANNADAVLKQKALDAPITGAMPTTADDIDEMIGLLGVKLDLLDEAGDLTPALKKKIKLRMTHLKQKKKKILGGAAPKPKPAPKAKGPTPKAKKPPVAKVDEATGSAQFEKKLVKKKELPDPTKPEWKPKTVMGKDYSNGWPNGITPKMADEDFDNMFQLVDFVQPKFLNKSQLEEMDSWLAKQLAKDPDADGLMGHLVDQIKEQLAKYDDVFEDVLVTAGKAKAVNPLNFPDIQDLDKLQDVQSLGGSTGAKLVVDPKTGQKYVLKKGANPGHLREEAIADELYRAAGLDVPEGVLYETSDGPVKLTLFEDDTTAFGNLKGAKLTKASGELSDGFAMDALLGNWDVVGMSGDNVLVTKSGKVLRIDNGGSLRYRAMGSLKSGDQWTDEVLELKTMRDAATNPQTAKAFGKLSDEDVAKQIRQLADRKAQILDAAPQELRERLAARLQHMEDFADGVLGKAPPAPKVSKAAKASKAARTPNSQPKVRQPDYEVDKAHAKAAKKAKINGRTRATDKGDIEDNNVLAWEEIGADGKKQTRLGLKVTKDGSDKIEDTLGDALVSATSDVHPKDKYWDDILGAAKTVNHHADDGAYNMAKIEALKNAKTELQSATGIPAAMKKEYLKQMDAILDAQSKGGKVPIFKRYKHVPDGGKKKTSFKVTRKDKIEFETRNHKDGVGQVQSGVNNSFSGEMHVVDLGDGVEMRFVKATGSHSEQQGLAFQGTVEIKVPGEISEKTLNRAYRVLEEMGVDITPPTPEYEEILYLHRSVYLNNNHKLKGYRAIWENDSLSDAEKLDQMRKWFSKKYGVKLPPKGKATDWYNPGGMAKGSDGSGTRHWLRPEMPESKIEAELAKTHYLTHSMGSDIEDVLPKILDSGGEMTTTVGRTRKGVNVSATGGMSSSTDVSTGGASYFFTRIAKRGENAHSQLFFKPKILARQDAVSYSGDKFGRISALSQRGKDIGDYKKFAGYGGNETIFKEGINLLDDVEFIRAGNTAQRLRLIKVFHDRGIRRLPDGRLIEDVIVTSIPKTPPAI